MLSDPHGPAVAEAPPALVLLLLPVLEAPLSCTATRSRLPVRMIEFKRVLDDDAGRSVDADRGLPPPPPTST